jgi:hypothetical protein
VNLALFLASLVFLTGQALSQISSQKRNLVATSTANSAWAVWKNLGKDLVAVVSGPPVEYGPQEEKYVEAIGRWYGSLDGTTREDLENESADEAAAEG